MLRKFLFLFFLSILGFAPYGGHAQEALPATHAITEEQWQKAAGSMDYSKDVPEEEKPQKKRDPMSMPKWNMDTAFWGKLFQALAVVLAIGGLAYALIRMLRQPRNRMIARDGVEITLDNLEEYLHETDLERFLRAALAEGNYPLALRIYYLQVIKDLSERGHINWARQKTNRDYITEMRRNRLSDDFRSVTRTYERIWYGNAPLDASGFARLEPGFLGLLKDIKGH